MGMQIALRRMCGEQYSVIAKAYAVSEGAVAGVINGKAWKDARITATFLFDLEKECSQAEYRLPSIGRRIARCSVRCGCQKV